LITSFCCIQMDFSQRLLFWYTHNRRMLPWRESKDPYKIWLSEIILQQTRMEQGLVYYAKFIDAFPDVHALAAASEEQVLRLWQGLGYYTRARNLHAVAREIAFNRQAVFPETYKEWLKLKGVGPYTAAAVTSIAFGQPVAALDGNAYRVLSRLFAVEESIDSPAGKKTLTGIANTLIDSHDPGGFNQAMMDFGSQVCKPGKPVCRSCMFNRECLAFLKDKVAHYPVKSQKKKTKQRYFNYFFIVMPSQTGRPGFFVQKRHGQDIWKHLYEWPLTETMSPATLDAALLGAAWYDACQPVEHHLSVNGIPVRLIHQLTHQTIHASFWVIQADPSCEKKMAKHFLLVNAEEFEDLAKPRLIEHAFRLIRASLNF
jgi:A/G-specific adenine glycosylase